MLTEDIREFIFNLRFKALQLSIDGRVRNNNRKAIALETMLHLHKATNRHVVIASF
jgi:hypothetical protein